MPKTHSEQVLEPRFELGLGRLLTTQQDVTVLGKLSKYQAQDFLIPLATPLTVSL